MPEWKDATPYTQGQRGKKAPTAWEATIDGARIWVSCGHKDYPDVWVMTRHELGIDTRPLCATDADGSDLASVKSAAIMKAWWAAKEKARKFEGLSDSLFANL